MIPGRIEGTTQVLGAPKDWNAERDGPCGGLPIRVERIDEGRMMISSAWFPTAEELLLLQAGAPVILRVRAHSHPVVALGVGKAPE